MQSHMVLQSIGRVSTPISNPSIPKWNCSQLNNPILHIRFFSNSFSHHKSLQRYAHASKTFRNQALIRQTFLHPVNFCFIPPNAKFQTSKGEQQSQQKDVSKEATAKTASASPATTTSTQSSAPSTSPSSPAPTSFYGRSKVWIKNLPQTLKETMHHYWVGTKLLLLEIKTAYGIVKEVTQGKKLSRRERRLLTTTFRDLLRLIPFAVFVIVPFAEFALPFALALFPNMLPSTFEDKLKKEEMLKKKLKAKIEFAKFLQDVAEEMATKKASPQEPGGTDLLKFMQRVRAGERVSNQEILEFAKHFQDDFTLDNLGRPQLLAMSKLLGLSSVGTNNFLRYQLSRKLESLKADDKTIQEEGVDMLTVEELQSALRARGMRANSTSKLVLRRRLNEWLDLSLNQNLPQSLLVLSRAFTITERETAEEALKDTLSSLPDDLVEGMKLKIDEEQGKADPELKLEVLKSQKEMVQEEKKEESESKTIKETAPSVTPTAATASKQPLTEEKLEEVAEAVAVLANFPARVGSERQDLEELKTERQQLKTQVEVEKSEIPQPLKAETEVPKATEKPTKPAEEGTERKKEEEKQKKMNQRFQEKLDKMVKALEQEIEKVDQALATRIHVIDKDKDGVISIKELSEALGLLKEKLTEEKVNEIIHKFDTDKDGKISLDEVIQHFEKEQAKHSSKT